MEWNLQKYTFVQISTLENWKKLRSNRPKKFDETESWEVVHSIRNAHQNTVENWETKARHFCETESWEIVISVLHSQFSILNSRQIYETRPRECILKPPWKYTRASDEIKLWFMQYIFWTLSRLQILPIVYERASSCFAYGSQICLKCDTRPPT